jgi:murein DD-endopeptidase MepM/ murein hydrolase activator NlpD
MVIGSATALVGSVAGFHTMGLAAPVAPVASPVAGPVVTGYAEVGPGYDAASAALLAQGREVADQLFGGDAATVYDRMSPALQGMYTKERLASLEPSLTTDRVHFELPQVGGVFDGHLAGRTIEGFYTQGSTTTFSLTADGEPKAGAPVDGRWTGQIGGGTAAIQMAVTFATVAGRLSGTLDVPAQKLTGLPLSNLSYARSVALGERETDEALPVSSTNRAYVAQYPWGEDAIALAVGISPEGGVAALTVAPVWPLPVDPAADYESEIAYRLPFDGVWWVFWGGDTVLQNYHVEYQNQRHAYDIVVWKDGGTHTGDGKRNEDYWAFGQPLFAPAAGTVVEVLDGIANNAPGVLNPKPHPAGNHVVIQTAEREFVYLAHMKQHSIRVKQSDRVGAGDLLGLAGNSGNSSEPHLHVHVQDKADFFAPDAVGLPLRFSDYLADGQPVAKGVPVQGQFIERG